jgi:ribosome-associated protein
MIHNGHMSPDEDLRAARGVRIKADALVWTFSRSSGAGGQNVNKNSTKATLTIALADISCSATIRARFEETFDEEISITCQTSRSQWRNRVLCVEQLTEKLNEASAPPPAPRKKTRPTRGSIERRLDSKKRDSAKKQDRRLRE